MSRQKATQEKVLETAKRLIVENNGKMPSVTDVQAITDGSRTTVTAYMASVQAELRRFAAEGGDLSPILRDTLIVFERKVWKEARLAAGADFSSERSTLHRYLEEGSRNLEDLSSVNAVLQSTLEEALGQLATTSEDLARCRTELEDAKLLSDGLRARQAEDDCSNNGTADIIEELRQIKLRLDAGTSKDASKAAVWISPTPGRTEAILAFIADTAAGLETSAVEI